MSSGSRKEMSEMNRIYESIKPYMVKGKAYDVALALLEWDQETLAPPEAEEYTAKVIGELSDSYLQVMVNDEVKKALEKLSDEKEQQTLTEEEKAIVAEWKTIVRQLSGIPKEEYREYSTLVARAGSIWSKAKEKNDFQLYLPTLKQIVAYKRKFAEYRKKQSKEYKKKELYDICLEDFEPGFTMETLDTFFAQIKEEIVPFFKEIKECCKKVDKSYNEKRYSVDKQKEFCRWLSGYIGFDFNRGVIGESAHPFTTNLHNHDVRITNHYHENNLESAIFSAIHETGHALYEMGVDSQITLSILGTGTSMGMHESQSRFWENVIGRSDAFWEPIYAKLQEMFPEQLKQVSLSQFIKGCNKIEPGPIRTEADELSYSLHILVRYELEKQLISGECEVEDLEQAWNKKYEECLGISPKKASEGVLQDIHWACGNFGYFPSYAIGTAVAAQLYYHMKECMPIEQYLRDGNFTPIREYLKEHIYQYGKKKTTQQILKDITGEEFSPTYYIKYLKEKYTALYKQ